MDTELNGESVEQMYRHNKSTAERSPIDSDIPPEQKCKRSRWESVSCRLTAEQQQYWYQQHLLSLQQRAKAHAQGQQQPKGPGIIVKDAPEQRIQQEEGKVTAPNQQSDPPSLNEPLIPASKKEEPPVSSTEPKLNIEPPEDSEEDLRLQQLQVAAAQWQQHPHHRVGFQYQRIMQKHAQLQQILQKYQQIIQQPPPPQTMSVDMQLQHYETQQKQFQQLHKEWEREFQGWQDQLQTYPHKDQLQEFDGLRGRGFDRFEGPRQRGPRFEGQHLEGPRPRFEATTSSQAPAIKPTSGAVKQERWDEDSFHGLWDTSEDKGANLEYALCKPESVLPHTVSSSGKIPPPGHTPIPSSVPSSIPKPPLIQQTVDYGHGRDITTSKVEQIPYGERITLRPEPLPERQPFPKEHPGQRDRYNRERDHCQFRLKDICLYTDWEFRAALCSRNLRAIQNAFSSGRAPPTGPSRTQSYRDKKDHPSSRRGGFERPSYERKPDRPTYDHGPSIFGGDRRNYSEERMPISAPSVPRQPPPAPRVERKPESKNVDDILKPPGRDSRPERIVIIMRGLPGSGKTHVAKLIRDKEVECGGPAPRVLSLDDYFITEVEKEERDPDTGKKVKKKVMEYEYEADMEETYRTSMFKTFKKTLDDGFFPFIILDAINDRVRHFEQFWSAAKTKGFEVYLAEMSADNQTCSKRNIHGRKLKEINRMSDHWETAPRHMMRLDIRSLLQDAAIEEVEMEDFDANIEDQKEESKKDTAEEEESELGYIPKSKWEMDTSEAKLDKLDGLRTGTKRKRDWEAIASRMEDYLQLPDDYDTRASEPGKKRVRWADLEEKKDADRKRAIGFVVGQTDWEKITDESGHLAERALNRTKYI
ncbi:YLP motif-containing protein 1 [Chelonia mydas]|uniref:YLP motif-containing protein 1 n=1 Tax=Chelonia mydas TaxID=8469 RepID=M7BF16_CHEMY|nr:YLP motif-containing protein 1 [Chelonia mydas]